MKLLSFLRRPVEALKRKGFQIITLGGLLTPSKGDPVNNSAVAAVLRWCVRAISEPPMVVKDAKGEVVEKHPALDLIANPNSVMSEDTMRSAIAASLVMAGNAYVLKVSGIYSAPVELWPLQPSEVVLDRDPITGMPRRWMYRTKAYELDQIIHIRDGVDPSDPLLGWSGMKSLLNEIASDTEASEYTAAILHNFGVPGAIISLKDPENSEVTPEVAESIKDRFRRSFTGKNRGDAMVITVPIQVDVPGISPDKMALDIIRKVPERRICAVIGVPPIVAGLGEDPKYDNYRAAREAAYESWAVPMWRIIARGLSAGLTDLLKGNTLDFDLKDVRALQEDADAIAKRWSELYQGDVVTKNEARAAIGLEPTPDGDKFASDSSTGRRAATDALRNRQRTTRQSSEAS